MAVRKLRRSWWVDFRWRGSRFRKRSPLNSADGAREYEVRLRRALMEHGTVDVEPTIRRQPTFGEFADRWLRDYVDVNNGVSEQYNKRRVLKHDLLLRFGNRLLRDIGTADVEALKRDLLARGLKPKSVNIVLGVLRRCLVIAQEWNELETVPRIRFLRAPLPTYGFLELHELLRLLDHCEPWLRLFVLTAGRAGLRWSELAALEWGDVDLERRTLRVARAYVRGVTKYAKNAKIRYLPMTADLYAALAAVRSDAPPGELVFWIDGRRLSHSRALYSLHRACRAAGIQVVGIHALRHTFATHLASTAAPIRAIQELLGHGSLTMTLRYAHATPGALMAAIAQLDRATGQAGQQTVNIDPLPAFPEGVSTPSLPGHSGNTT